MTEFPANIGRFLDAVDKVLNSNTLLFRMPWRTAIAPDELPRALAHFIQSDAFRSEFFRQMMDQGAWTDEASTSSRRLVVEPLELAVRSVSGVALVSRLLWMLTTEECSWYRQHMPVSDALPLVQRLVVDLMGAQVEADDSLLSVESLAHSIPRGWSFAQLAPSFLYSSGYFDSGRREAPEGALAYFDGSKADGCLVMQRGTSGWMLLTNGSP